MNEKKKDICSLIFLFRGKLQGPSHRLCKIGSSSLQRLKFSMEKLYAEELPKILFTLLVLFRCYMNVNANKQIKADK